MCQFRFRTWFAEKDEIEQRRVTRKDVVTLTESPDLQQRLRDNVNLQCIEQREGLDAAWAERNPDEHWQCLNAAVVTSLDQLLPALRKREENWNNAELERHQHTMKEFRATGPFLADSVMREQFAVLQEAVVIATSGMGKLM